MLAIVSADDRAIFAFASGLVSRKSPRALYRPEWAYSGARRTGGMSHSRAERHPSSPGRRGSGAHQLDQAQPVEGPNGQGYRPGGFPRLEVDVHLPGSADRVGEC